MGPVYERDTAEIRILRAIEDLNFRILNVTTEDERTNLRGSIVALRAEVVKLIEAMPIVSEDDVRRARAQQGLAIAPMTIRGCS